MRNNTHWVCVGFNRQFGAGVFLGLLIYYGGGYLIGKVVEYVNP